MNVEMDLHVGSVNTQWVENELEKLLSVFESAKKKHPDLSFKVKVDFEEFFIV